MSPRFGETVGTVPGPFALSLSRGHSPSDLYLPMPRRDIRVLTTNGNKQSYSYGPHIGVCPELIAL